MLPFDLLAQPPFDGPLIPTHDNWPVFDEVLMCAFSPSPSVEPDPLPSSAALAAMPIPPSRVSPRNKKPGHIPRPRNAFMLFRSAFAAARKIGANIEHDNRHITRIIAHCWNRLSDAEKQVWRDKAAAEKAQHAQRYPDYRFSPVGRANRPVKRKVHRNGVADVKRCEKLAELVMAGKFGQELESAVKRFDDERHSTEHSADVSTGAEMRGTRADPDSGHSEPSEVPPFRSPLLPPTTTAPEHVSDESLIPEPLARIATTNHVEPQAFHTLPGDSLSDDLRSLMTLPRPQHYQSTMSDSASSPRSVPPLDLQSVMHIVQSIQAEPERSGPDFSLFSWDQSDSFSCYN